MSRAKRTQIQLRKLKENIPRYKTELIFDEEKVSEKAMIISALIKQSEETEHLALTTANKGISLIRIPKETLLTIFEVIVPKALSDSKDVEEMCSSFVGTIKESNTVIFQLYK